jgi:hypothetical protein
MVGYEAYFRRRKHVEEGVDAREVMVWPMREEHEAQ